MEDIYFFIVDVKTDFAKTYLDRRLDLKKHVAVSKTAVCPVAYPNFALQGIKLLDPDYREALEEYFCTVDTGLKLKYGVEYDEFETFCTADYNIFGTDFLMKNVRW